MAEYLSPGVYVEEFDSGVKAMEGPSHRFFPLLLPPPLLIEEEFVLPMGTAQPWV